MSCNYDVYVDSTWVRVGMILVDFYHTERAKAERAKADDPCRHVRSILAPDINVPILSLAFELRKCCSPNSEAELSGAL